MKPIEYYRGKEQTYLKHLFLEQYLETVAYHIGFTHREFAYVDCFSGPWRAADEDLGDTSIRIALERLDSVHDGLSQLQRRPRIRAFFVEKSPSSFEALQQMLRQYNGPVETTALFGTFEENISRLISAVGTTFTFFFIDPTGWKGFAMDNIRPILRHRPGEVMINFMYDFINRFLSYEDPSNEDSLDSCFGTTEWRAIRDLQDRESAEVELYLEQLRKTGRFPYVTSSQIVVPVNPIWQDLSGRRHNPALMNSVWRGKRVLCQP